MLSFATLLASSFYITSVGTPPSNYIERAINSQTIGAFSTLFVKNPTGAWGVKKLLFANEDCKFLGSKLFTDSVFACSGIDITDFKNQWSYRVLRGGIPKLFTKPSQSVLKILRLRSNLASRSG